MRRFAVVLMMGLLGCAPGFDLPVPTAYETLAKAPELERFAQVDNDIFRGGAITHPEQMRDLRVLGIKTIINLQNPAYGSERPMIANEKAMAQKEGLHFISLPMGAEAAPTHAFTKKVLGVLQDPALQPVYIHCRRGRDRTGTLVGAYRVLVEGWTGKQALKEMESFGFDRREYPFFADYLLNLGSPSDRLAS